jgi:EAL domain-containing protein (putative c-di-GMP-specific phosphodiesterase class I)
MGGTRVGAGLQFSTALTLSRASMPFAVRVSSIVTAVISMGRSLKLRVVAEGVETEAELAFLQAHQCEEAQGYYFSRPVPPQQFGKLLKAGISEHVSR